MRNEMELTFSRIVLRVPNAGQWQAAKLVTGKVEEITPGVYEMALSAQNLNRIAHVFTGANLPVIVSGKKFLDREKEKLADYKRQKAAVLAVLAKDNYPVDPNGKFVPYAHQTKIIGVALANPYAAISASCGLGKTGAMGRLMEIVLQRGEVAPGKILVSAPLSILDVSWGADLDKFTHLRWAKLWSHVGNRDLLYGDEVELTDLGPKPLNAIKSRTKTGVRYFNPQTHILKEELNALDGEGWIKYAAKWKVATDLTGLQTPYGVVRGRVTAKENTRGNFIVGQLERKDVDVFLINHDGVRVHEKLLRKHGFQWIVVDESTKIKNPQAVVASAHVEISWNAVRRNTMSGTPNPNGFEDLWFQYYFLDRGLTLEPAKADFLGEYFVPVSAGRVHTKAGPKDIIKYRLRDEATRDALVERVKSVGIFLDQRDCIDLPPRTDMKRIAFMTVEQERAYDEMAETLVATLHDVVTNNAVESEALNALSKIMRLRQITSGFLANRDGELVSLTNNPKLEDLDGFLDDFGDKKLVLACQFREEIRVVLDRYKEYGCCAIYGGVNAAERKENIERFQNDDSTRIIVLQPAAASHGITLTRSSYLMFLSLSYNFEHYYQIAKRIERIGQRNNIFVLHSLSRYADGTETIDEVLLDILNMKAQDHDSLYGGDNVVLARTLLDRITKQVEARK